MPVKGFEIKAQTLDHANPKILYKNVCVSDQGHGFSAISWGLQIQHDVFFINIHGHEIGSHAVLGGFHPARAVAIRRFDFDDFSTQHAQQGSCPGACSHDAHIHNLESRQRANFFFIHLGDSQCL